MTRPSLAASRVADLVEAYLASDYQWEFDGRWYPLQLGEVAADVEAAYPDGTSSGLLAAWNPCSIERPEAENRRADEELAAILADSGMPHRAGFSAARNRTWREPGWLVVGMPVERFDALARRFGQLGTLYAARGEPMRLRIYHARPTALAAAPLVDWVG